MKLPDPPPSCHPELRFPLDWHARIITMADVEEVEEALQRTLLSFGVTTPLRPSNASSGRRYLSYAVCVHVTSRDMLDRLTHAIGAIEGVRMVL